MSTDAVEVATLQDIAQLAGVSTATVSRALNGRPGVSSAKRAEIVQLAATHGFTGNVTARALSLGRHGRVAVVLPQVQAEYFARILAGASEEFHARGLSMTLTTTGYSHERERQIVDQLSRSPTDGALIVLPQESLHELGALQRTGFPFVVVDPEEPIDLPLPWFSGNHVAGARQVGQHLLGLGHTLVAVVGWDPSVLANQDRLHGLRQAMRAAGQTLDERLVRWAEHAETEDGYGPAQELLSLAEPPTAIFALNDNLAFGVLRAASHRGVAVPRQLSVVGFDDLGTASLVTPMLTTVRQPLTAMGAAAARVLLDWMGGEAPTAMHVQLPTELVVRESTAAPARSRGRATAAGRSTRGRAAVTPAPRTPAPA